MKDIKQMINQDLVNILSFGKPTQKEIAVLGILSIRWGDKPVTQREIAEHTYWKKATESTHKSGSIDTTMREVRRVIRKLRITHKLAIMHSSSGYYLPESQSDMEEFIGRLEQEAKGRAASSMETYKVMKDTLGISSPLFEQLDFVGTQLIKTI
jgi:hypothetical protein